MIQVTEVNMFIVSTSLHKFSKMSKICVSVVYLMPKNKKQAVSTLLCESKYLKITGDHNSSINQQPVGGLCGGGFMHTDTISNRYVFIVH